MAMAADAAIVAQRRGFGRRAADRQSGLRGVADAYAGGALRGS